ncbi:hypothetical protein BGZ49_005275, partial [Haplosporangium sp. Z 27]
NLEKQLGQRSSTDGVGDKTDEVGDSTNEVGCSTEEVGDSIYEVGDSIYEVEDETVTTETNTNNCAERVITIIPVAEHRNPDGTISHEDTTSDVPSQGSDLNQTPFARPQIPMTNILAGNINNSERRNTNEE